VSFQVGILLNRKSYPLIEYLEAAMITAGVAMFTLSEKSQPDAISKNVSFLCRTCCYITKLASIFFAAFF
jgi:hypothetical protein